MSWIRLAHTFDIPPREGRRVRIGPSEIALFNLGDRFTAIENMCPHQGGPLADGIVVGAVVVCPLHAWKICLDTGAVRRPVDVAACLKIYPTRVEGGIVWIDIPATEEIQEAAKEWLTGPPVTVRHRRTDPTADPG